MARQGKPFCKGRFWYSKIDGYHPVKLLPSTESFEAADAVRARLKAERQAQEPASQANCTVAQAVHAYLDALPIAAETKKNKRSILKRLVAVLGSKQVSGLSRADVARWQESLADLSDNAKFSHVKYARALLNWCCKPSQRYATQNVFLEVNYPQTKGRERLCTTAEFARCLRFMPLFWRQVFCFLRLCGCRPQDIGNSRWSCLRGSVLDFSEHKTSAKTGIRHLLLGTRAVKLLGILKRTSTSDLIFAGVSTKTIGRVWLAARRKAGLEASQGEQLTAYSQRHTCLTRYGCQKDFSVPELLCWTGHADLRMALRYIHPDLQKLAKRMA